MRYVGIGQGLCASLGISRLRLQCFNNVCSVQMTLHSRIKNYYCENVLYSVEIIYGINSVISKPMTFAENAETGRFLFLIMLILSYFTCS
jgi:hypothetical protein